MAPGKKYPIRPETRQAIIERDQAPVPPTLTGNLMARCYAYADADKWTAYYLKAENVEAAAIASATRDRTYDQLKPLLEELVIQ